VDGRVVTALAGRTGGNPFYAREIARLLASEGALVAVSEVPEGVRDVLRRRLARLPPPAVAVLRLAAVVGRDAEVEMLVDAADADEGAVLDGLEAGVFSGLLTEPAPGRVRFTHELVRDTLYGDLTQLRRTRMHGRVADSLRRLRRDDVTGLAHQYLRSASASTAAAAVEYAIQAADLADRRYAYDTEVSLLEQALEAFGRITEHEEDPAAREVSLLGRLLRAQIRAGPGPRGPGDPAASGGGSGTGRPGGASRGGLHCLDRAHAMGDPPIRIRGRAGRRCPQSAAGPW
jgi:predicted ATPase